MTATLAPVPARHVPARRVRFEYSLDDLPKHFAADGDPLMSHILAVLSAIFPNGEDFFVRSVRNFRDQVTDPELKKQVGGFIGQEAIHGREHRALNDKLAELGYPVRRIDAVVDRSLKMRERLMSKKSNLAATAALEHYTATLAETLLTKPEARAQLGHAEVTSLFCWHALEESEHKAVAFDVYKHVGGSERTRVLTMKVINVGFLGFTAVCTLLSMLGDRHTWRHPIKTLKSIGKLRRTPFITRDIVSQIGSYNAETFHPDDRDTEALVAEWRDELFGEDGTLNSRLPQKG